MTNHNYKRWTPEQDDLLRKYKSMGMPSSKIAIMLGQGLSRNAVIGRCSRIGICAPQIRLTPAQKEAKEIARRERDSARKRGKRRADGKPEWPVMRQRAFLATQPLTDAPVSLCLSIEAWTSFSCRWIDGEDYLACGHFGYPYCPYHKRIAYKPEPPAKREKRGWGSTGVHFGAHV